MPIRSNSLAISSATSKEIGRIETNPACVTSPATSLHWPQSERLITTPASGLGAALTGGFAFSHACRLRVRLALSYMVTASFTRLFDGHSLHSWKAVLRPPLRPQLSRLPKRAVSIPWLRIGSLLVPAPSPPPQR